MRESAEGPMHNLSGRTAKTGVTYEDEVGATKRRLGVKPDPARPSTRYEID